jgi:Protein of unknown function (DUF1353)
MTKHAKFEGRPVITFLPDGRRVKTVEPFAFIDAASQRWDVPAGATVDGASIPRALWTLLGGPFEGKYRDASIIHDWYCDLRCRPWQSTHLAFYEAMRASDVPTSQAKLLYAGVYFGGPRWSKTVEENVNLYRYGRSQEQQQQQQRQESAERYEINYSNPSTRQIVESFKVSTVEMSVDQVKKLKALIEKNQSGIRSITKMIEKERMAYTKSHPDAEVNKIVEERITVRGSSK